jgi:hypothetical protein
VRGVIRSFQTFPQAAVTRSNSHVIKIRRGHRRFRNLVEERMVTRNLLRELANSRLPQPVSATLKCVAALGPHGALNERGRRAIDESAGWGQRRYVHLLDTVPSLWRRGIHGTSWSDIFRPPEPP